MAGWVGGRGFGEARRGVNGCILGRLDTTSASSSGSHGSPFIVLRAELIVLNVGHTFEPLTSCWPLAPEGSWGLASESQSCGTFPLWEELIPPPAKHDMYLIMIPLILAKQLSEKKDRISSPLDFHPQRQLSIAEATQRSRYVSKPAIRSRNPTTDPQAKTHSPKSASDTRA